MLIDVHRPNRTDAETALWPLKRCWSGWRPSPAKKDAVEEFLLSALPLVEQEPGTKPWFAVKFGPSTFGIIDAFPDEEARETHLGGPVGKALADKADELFASPPDISKIDVLANKL